MPAVSLRAARSDELDTIGDLMVAAYAQFSPPIPPPMWQEYADEIRDVRARLPHSTLVVAEDASRVLGAVTYYPSAAKESKRPGRRRGPRSVCSPSTRTRAGVASAAC